MNRKTFIKTAALGIVGATSLEAKEEKADLNISVDVNKKFKINAGELSKVIKESVLETLLEEQRAGGILS